MEFPIARHLNRCFMYALPCTHLYSDKVIASIVCSVDFDRINNNFGGSRTQCLGTFVPNTGCGRSLLALGSQLKETKT